jgi:Flp pilus assembly protein TadG
MSAGPRRRWTVLGRLGRQFAQARDAVTAVEFALLTPPFLAILFTVVQFGFKYYFLSIVHAQTFALGQAVIQPSTRPAAITDARASFAAGLQSNYGVTAPGNYVLYVGRVTATTPTSAPPSGDYYSPTPLAPVLIRVVYPSIQLIDLTALMPAWPAMFSPNVDVSVVVVPK